MAVQWKLAYDFADDADPGAKIFIGVSLAALAGIAYWYLRNQRLGADTFPPHAFGTVLGVMAVLSVVQPAYERRKVMSEMAAGRVLRVEGPVSGHREWTESRAHGQMQTLSKSSDESRYEAITVGDVVFELPRGWLEAKLVWRGEDRVPLRDGLPLRISYLPDPEAGASTVRKVVRVEIGNDGSASMPAR